jgi:hypothetical protein
MTITEELTTEYLARLRRAAADLPAGARAELCDDIRAHLAESLGTDADEATAREVLDELGSPEEIVAAAAAETGTRPAGRSQGALLYDVAAVLVLLLGGFVVPVAGWVAGVVMLWAGPRWGLRQKWGGTLLWPAAIVVGALALLADHVARGRLVAVVVIGALVVLAGLISGCVWLLRTAARTDA